MQSEQEHGGGPSEFLTVAQAAGLLQLNTNHVYRLLNDGVLPGRKLGGAWRISRRQLLAFIEGAAQ